MKRGHIILLFLFFIGSTYGASVNYIQRGTTTLTGTSTTVTLCNSVTLSQSLLLFSCSNSNNTPDGVLVAGELSASTITFIRNGSNGTVTIAWEVVEFSSGVSVQHGSTNVSGTTTNQSITAVSTSKSFVICSMYNNGSTYGTDDGVTAQLTSTTNLQFRCDAATFTAYWQVVEYDSCSVQQLSISLSGTSATGTVTGVNTAKTMVIGNHRQSETSMPMICLELNSPTALR